MARQLRLPRPHAALVLAAQARRDALDGSAEEALENWRSAVAHAIHEGRTDDASGWPYAIRAVNGRYGPWTSRFDEEHLLAQSLPKTGSGRLIRRVRDPETDARRAALAGSPIEAIRAWRLNMPIRAVTNSQALRASPGAILARERPAAAMIHVPNGRPPTPRQIAGRPRCSSDQALNYAVRVV
jgi:hypothetical protein